MDEKIFCNIMNRIRKRIKQHGWTDVSVKFSMLDGSSFLINEISDYEICDGFIEAIAQDDMIYIPIKNITSITI